MRKQFCHSGVVVAEPGRSACMEQTVRSSGSLATLFRASGMTALFIAVMSVTACAQEADQSDVPFVPTIDIVRVAQLDPQPSQIIRKAPSLLCTGVPEQGGAVKCQTSPNAQVKIGRSEDDFYYERASDTGEIIVGFDRDETRALISVDDAVVEYNFTPRDYDVSRIDGLPPSQVSSFTEAQLKRIRSSSARKKIGFESRAQNIGLTNGFIHPLENWNKSSPFGAQRILNGEAKRPHYGVDIAAPVGTVIYAPADGIVSLADDDLYFEGAMVMLDHGQGLNSMYLHVSDIFVEAGQAVKQGEKIAAVGSRGRSTGPHLCWRLKWRNRNLDPELLTQWPDHDGDYSHE